MQLIRHSSYYDREKFENHIQSHLKCFSILGTNIQGIGKYLEFIQEISPLLVSIEKENSECIVAGDFNIDLLKINEKAIFSELPFTPKSHYQQDLRTQVVL